MIHALVQFFCIAASLATLAVVTAPMMPLHGHDFGNDWGYFLSYLLAGEQWVRANGWLAPAWFTPAFCGGMPFLANPQSMVWSVPQVVFVLLGPMLAPWCTLLMCAAFGGWGAWLLARRRFDAPSEFASLACVLFVLNGFLAFRLVAGHASFWAACLLPWLAWLTLDPPAGDPPRRRHAELCSVVAAGLLLAAMAFGGALVFVVPALLGTAALILLRQSFIGSRRAPWLRLLAAAAWSVPLAAIKLVPAVVLTLQYPRDALRSSLFSDFWLLLDALLSGFFWPANLLPSQPLGSGQASFYLHEFEFGVSIVPLIVLLAWGLRAVMERRRPAHAGPLIMLLVVFAVPLAGAYGTPEWGAFLQHIPIVGSNSNLIRWWVIYLLPLIMLTATALGSLATLPRARQTMLVGCSVVAIAQFALRDLAPYRDGQPALFDATPIAKAHAELAAGGSLPTISALGGWPDGSGGSLQTVGPASLARGISSLPCYEPLFGYLLELFPARSLQQGPVAGPEEGNVNLADPRCYLDPGQHACHPGDRFTADDPAAAAFVAYRPMTWRAPYWQRAAEWASAFSLSLSLCFLVVIGLARGARR